MSSSEVAKITRPAPHYWAGRVGRSFMGVAKVSGVLSVITGGATFYWLVIRKKAIMDEYEARCLTEEAMEKKFDNMNRMKCFRSMQPDKYEWS